MTSTTPALSNLQHFAGHIKTSHVLLVLIFAATVWLIADYTRMLLLRRKLARPISPLPFPSTNNTPLATRSPPAPNNRQHASPTWPQTLDLLRVSLKNLLLTHNNLLDRSFSNNLAKRQHHSLHPPRQARRNIQFPPPHDRLR
jgi:hypothetical protein